MYLATLALGIAAAHEHGLRRAGSGLATPIEITWQSGLIFLLVFAGFSFFLARTRGFSRLFLKIVIVGVVLYGSGVSLGALVAWPGNIILVLAVALLFLTWPRVLVHDLGMILGIAGISAVLGLSLTPTAAMIILAALSLYDIIAVYRTGHMVRLARTMVESGTIFGFLVPARTKGFFARREQAFPGGHSVSQSGSKGFMMLGSGDVSLPLIFICSLVTVSLTSAITAAGFALIGLFIMHLMFANQEENQPMAALPPIATLTIVGYLVSLAL